MDHDLTDKIRSSVVLAPEGLYKKFLAKKTTEKLYTCQSDSVPTELWESGQQDRIASS